MFRRIAIRKPENSTDVTLRTIDSVSLPVKNQIRTIFLQGFGSTQSNGVRHKISDAIAELAKPNPTNKQDIWGEILPALFEASKNQDASLRESAYRIFSAIPELIDISLLGNIVPIFHAGFEDPSDDVRVASVTAFVAFFETLPKSSWPTLNPLLPSLLKGLPPLLNNGNDSSLASVLESLIELVELAPKMFKSMFSDLINFCISVAKNKELESAARLAALELLTTFSEYSPNMCKKEPLYLNSLVLQSLMMMTEVGEDDDDAAEWNNSDDIEEEDDEYSAARQALDRLALRLADSILTPIFQWIPNMISSDNWRERQAALMALSSIAEGCSETLMNEIGKILDMCLPLLNDSHPRVQYACCNLLGQISTDFADKIQREFGDRILPALISKLSNQSVFRVQAHAAAALVNFSENATKDILEPFLDDLLTHLLTLLQSQKSYVQEQSLTTIAVIADAAENKFIKYYDTMMPLLFNVLKADTGKEHRLLKAKCIECSTLIALAVGKEKFAPHCQELATIFANIQNSITEDDDPCTSYLTQGWARICQIIGKDFLPFLSGVIPPLLASAKAEQDLHLLEDDTEIEVYDQDEGWDVVDLHGKHIGIHTSLLDEKANAIELLVLYASSLKGDFYPYVKEIAANVLSGLEFFFHDGVRYAAAQAILPLLICAKEANPGNSAAVLELAIPFIDKLLKALRIEPVLYVVSVFHSTLYQVIELLYENKYAELNDKQMESYVEAVLTNLKDYYERIKNKFQDDEYTEEVDDDEEESDEDLVGEMNKSIHSVFKISKGRFLPFFEKMLEILNQFLNEQNTDCLNFSLCVIDDLIETCGPDSWRYKDLFINKLGESLLHQNPIIRQVAAYGVGVAAQHGGEVYRDFSKAALEPLFKSISIPDARSEDNVYATENACAAIAKILRAFSSSIPNLDAVINEWIKTLPITNDDEAAPFAYIFLSELILAGHPAVASNLIVVVDDIIAALINTSIQGQTANKVITATKTIISNVPQQELAQIAGKYTPSEQQMIQTWFQ